MDLALDLLQGVGIAAAVGVRPLLPVLLAGGLAAGDVGLDFDGTDFSFLESVPFLIAVVVVLAIASVFAARAIAKREDGGGQALVYAIGAVSVVLGALEAGGSMADRGNSVPLGLVLGAAAALLGFLAARNLFARVRRRLDAETATALPVYAEGIALIAAGLSILFPPLAILVLIALAWLLTGGRRREGEKYAGLRVLR
jgi:uncharacterized membrane protein